MKFRDQFRIVRAVFLGRPQLWLASALLVAIPLLFITAGVYAVDAVTKSRPQIVQSALLGGDLSVALPGSSNYQALREPYQKVKAAWGDSGAASLHAIVPSSPIQNAHKTTSSQLEEADWKQFAAPQLFHFEQGHYPREAGQVALSTPVAKSLRAHIGSTIRLAYSPNPIKVAGLFTVTSDETTRSALLGSGTLGSLTIGASVSTRIPVVGSALLKSADHTHTVETQVALASLGPITEPADVPSPQPLWVTQPALITVPFLILLGIVALVGMATRLSKLRRDINIFIGIGVSRPDVQKMIVGANSLLLAGSTLVGLIVGISVGLLLRPIMAKLAHIQLRSPSLPWLTLATPVILLVVVVLAGSYFVASRSIDAAQNGSAAVPAGENSPQPFRTRHTLTLSGVAALIFVVLFAAPRSPVTTGLVTLGGSLLLLSLVPFLIAGIQRASKKARYQWATAVSFVAGDRGRSLGLIAICLFGVAIPITLSTVSDSYGKANDALYQPAVPAGQVDVKASSKFSASDVDSLARAAQSPAVQVIRPVRQPTTNQQVNWVLAASENGQPGSRDLLIVSSRSQAETVLGWKLSSADWSVVTSGQVLWLDPQFDGATHFQLQNDADGSRTTPIPVQAHGTGSTPNNAAVYQAGAIISTASAEHLGLPQTTVSYRFAHASDNFSAISTAATNLLIVPSDVQKDDGPPEIIPLSLTTTTWMATLLTLLLASLAVTANRAAQSRDRKRLTDLGARRSDANLVFLFETSLCVCIGAVFGLLSGTAAAAANMASGRIPVIIEWDKSALLVVAVIAAGIIPSLIAGRLASNSHPSFAIRG